MEVVSAKELIESDLPARVIFLFTRGRITRQRTIKNLLPEVRSFVVVVTSNGELDALRTEYAARGWNVLGFLGWPDAFRLIEKRYRSMHWALEHGIDAALMLDDDLTLSSFHPSSGKYSPRTDPAPSLWWKTLRLFDSHVGVGLAYNGRNTPVEMQKTLSVRGLHIRENSFICAAFGYRTKEFVEVLAPVMTPGVTDSVSYLDLISNILMMNCAGTIAKVYDIAWSTPPRGEGADAGGMNAYRNVKNDDLAVAVLQAFLPLCIEFTESSGKLSSSRKVLRKARRPWVDWAAKDFDFERAYEHLRLNWSRPSIKTAPPAVKALLLHAMNKLYACCGEVSSALSVSPSSSDAEVRAATSHALRGNPVNVSPGNPDLTCRIQTAVLIGWRKSFGT